uniref:3-hydroxyacyl-CoA dehydrogenase family protein n=1 Tax=Thermorudis sp. TaxID=1969470 RepID=A0A7C2WQE3_9BACT
MPTVSEGQSTLPIADGLLAWLRQHSPELDCGALCSAESVRQLADHGWLRLGVPEAVGGRGGGLDVVVEAIAERLDAKQDLLRNAEELVAPTAVLASTTSGLSATALGSALRRPERFVVAHYANPPHLMPVVEVVKGRQTSEATADLVLRLLRHTGKRPVLVRKDVPGFIFNRLQYALMREAVALVRDGVATPEDVDAIVKYGYALRLPAVGPLEMVDLVGLEIYETIATYLWPDLDCSKEPTVLRELLAKGAKGMVAGQGFYRWTPETIEALLRARDAEIVRQVKRLAAEERERPDGGGA